MTALLEPMDPRSSRSEVFGDYLDYFRTTLLTKLEALSPEQRTTSGLPSGWTPLELLKHLTFVERRWLVWGFLGAAVAEPWGDQVDGVWRLRPDEGLAELRTAFLAQAEVSRSILAAHPLSAVGRPGPRWAGAEPATLERVLFHLLQEYARHLGQLDVVCELAGGPVGE